jgi:hypothetical protein
MGGESPEAGAGGMTGTGGGRMKDSGADATEPPDAADASEPDGTTTSDASMGDAARLDSSVPDSGVHDGGDSQDAAPRPYSLHISVTDGGGASILGPACPLADGGLSIYPDLVDTGCISTNNGNDAECTVVDIPFPGGPRPGCTAFVYVPGRAGIGPPRNSAIFTLTGDPQPAMACEGPTQFGDVMCKLTWP